MSKVKKNLILLSTLLLISCNSIRRSSSINNSTSQGQTTDTTSSITNENSSINSQTSEESSSSSTQESSFTSSSKETSSSTSTHSSSLSSSSTSSSSSSSSSFNTSFDNTDYNQYYASVNLNSSGDNLIKALGGLLGKTHNTKSYDALWDGYILGDLKPGTHYLWDMYSNYNYDAYNPPKGNYSKEGDAVNREHSIPQSWFNEKSPMKSDYYQVVPTDGYVNNRRSNYPLGEVKTATYTSQNGSKLGSSSYPGISGTVFEPIDEYKGDFARIYFYMCTRYYSQVGSWSGGVFKSTFPYLQDGYFKLYLKWAQEDPVSDKERMRNEGGFKFQGNRNPYVDYPALLGRAFNVDIDIKEKTNEEKAQEIMDLISAIGEVTLNSKSKIESARNAYNNASDEVKQLVTNYNVLLQAEEAYQKIIDNSSSSKGEAISCTFTNKDFANNLNYQFESNQSPYTFEGERGVQFLSENDILITTASYLQGINKIGIIASSNQQTYNIEIKVGNYVLSSLDNTIKSKDENKELTFTSETTIAGEIQIHITSSSASKSFWIKAININ